MSYGPVVKLDNGIDLLSRTVGVRVPPGPPNFAGVAELV
jgi:hypothetical protein